MNLKPTLEVFQNPGVWPGRNGEKRVLKADVVLGSPKSNCSGVGICHVSVNGKMPGVTCPAYPAYTYSTQGGALVIAFMCTLMPEAALKRHFGGGMFIVQDRFVIPKSISSALGVSRRVIHPGQYKIIYKRQFVIVEFCQMQDH